MLIEHGAPPPCLPACRDYWLEIDVQNPQVWVGKPVALGQENGGTAGGLPPVGGVPPGKEGT